MVKAHSPIVQCKQPRKTMQVLQPNPDLEKESIPRPAKSSSCSPRKMSSQAQSNTRVTFSRRVAVKEVTHKDDLNPKIFERYWLTEAEALDIKEVVKATVKMMSRKQEINEDFGLCARGLESRTRAGHRQKTKNKESVKRAVLLQQCLQVQEGTTDEIFLAAVSMSKTAHCAEAARQAALRDAEDARMYLGV